MIVSFTTALGAKYHLDHVNNQWVQETPVERSGPLFNKPSVVVGKRVEIWTSDADKPVRVIVTAPVAKREVTLESQFVQQSEVLPGNAASTASALGTGA